MKLLLLSILPDKTTAIVKTPRWKNAIVKTPRWNYYNCQNLQMKLLQSPKLPDETTAIVKTPRWNCCNRQHNKFSRPILSWDALQKSLWVVRKHCQVEVQKKVFFFAMVFKLEETAPNKFSNNIQQFVLVNNNKFWQKNSSLSFQSAYDFQYFYHKSSLHL